MNVRNISGLASDGQTVITIKQDLTTWEIEILPYIPQDAKEIPRRLVVKGATLARALQNLRGRDIDQWNEACTFARNRGLLE